MFSARFLIPVVALATILSGTNYSAGQDQQDQQDQTRFVLKLDNNLIASLRSYGSLRSQVPEKHRNKISFVELQFDETRDSESIELGLPMQISADDASIVLDEDLIGQIKGQPVRVPVNKDLGQFSQIILKYEAPAVAPMLSGSEEDTLFVRMKDAQVMAGNVEGFSELAMETKFGSISIPMTEIAGIKFHTDSNDSAVVVLVNGDTVTGTPTVSALQLQTDWGKADIQPQFIESVTTGSNARFLQESGDFGSRWMLRTGTSIAPGSAPDAAN